MVNYEKHRTFVDTAKLPAEWTTSFLPASFWGQLGRTVATFGLLEETSKKAVFALSGTKQVPEEEAEEAIAIWYALLTKTSSDPLGALVVEYKKQLRFHPELNMENSDDLISDLNEVKLWRNAVCHASWMRPDEHGVTLPIYIDRRGNKWEDAVNEEFLAALRDRVAAVIVGVINTVTSMGYQFPGSKGPGKPLV